MRRTLVPYFDWSFDAPTTANRGEERKSFCICTTVRVMVDMCARATGSDTPQTRAKHTSWALPSPALIFPGLLRWLARIGATLFISQRTAAAYHYLSSTVSTLKREPCLGCPRHPLPGTSSMAFSSASLSPSQLRLPSPRTGNVQRTVRWRWLTRAPSNCGVTRY
jgi:hypothetical protein